MFDSLWNSSASTWPKGYISPLQTKANLKLHSLLALCGWRLCVKSVQEKISRGVRVYLFGISVLHKQRRLKCVCVNITEQKPVRQLAVSANKGAALGPDLALKTAPSCAMGLFFVQKKRVFDPMSLFPQHRNNMKCLQQTLAAQVKVIKWLCASKNIIECMKKWEKISHWSLLYRKTSSHWKTNKQKGIKPR